MLKTNQLKHTQNSVCMKNTQEHTQPNWGDNVCTRARVYEKKYKS